MSAAQALSNYGLFLFLALILSLCLHEFAHAWMADRLGDDTPRKAGRLTLNPLKHVSVLGTLAFILTQRVGWAKPVPINFANLGLRKTALVAFAGPALNFLLAFLGGLGLLVLSKLGLKEELVAWPAYFLTTLVYVNVFLGLVNLLPIPPLDGYRIALYFASRYMEIPEYTKENLKKYIALDFLGAGVLVVLSFNHELIAGFTELGNALFAFFVTAGGLLPM